MPLPPAALRPHILAQPPHPRLPPEVTNQLPLCGHSENSGLGIVSSFFGVKVLVVMVGIGRRRMGRALNESTGAWLIGGEGVSLG